MPIFRFWIVRITVSIPDRVLGIFRLKYIDKVLAVWEVSIPDRVLGIFRRIDYKCVKCDVNKFQSLIGF